VNELFSEVNEGRSRGTYNYRTDSFGEETKVHTGGRGTFSRETLLKKGRGEL